MSFQRISPTPAFDAPETVSISTTWLQIDSTATTMPTRVVLTNAEGVPVLDRWVTWRSLWNQPLLPGSYQVAITPLGGATTTRSLGVPLAGAKLVL